MGGGGKVVDADTVDGQHAADLQAYADMAAADAAAAHEGTWDHTGIPMLDMLVARDTSIGPPPARWAHDRVVGMLSRVPMTTRKGKLRGGGLPCPSPTFRPTTG